MSLFFLFLQRPFLDRAEHLTEDVVCVFPAADGLEQYIMSVMASVVGDDGLDSICRQKITAYQVLTFKFTPLFFCFVDFSIVSEVLIIREVGIFNYFCSSIIFSLPPM